jgi:TolB protein
VSISGDGNKIAFTRIMDKNIHLFVINSDGSGLKQLTERIKDYVPAVENLAMSYDGSKIAFQSTAESGREIFIINFDGSELKQLTTCESEYSKNIMPSISKDGVKVAFVYSYSILNENNTEIYIVNSDGSQLKQLTHNDIGDASPSISGDGTKIAFQQGFDNYTEIFVISSDGSGLMQLTNNNANDQYPSISDRGDKVVFGSGGDIFIVINKAQDNQTQPTENSGSMVNSSSESAFPTEILVGGIVAAVIVAAVLGAVYLKRK